MNIKSKPENLSGNHIHLHFFLHSVHKYTNICERIDLLCLKRGTGPSERGLLHICFHLLLKCVHIYIDIYDDIGLMVLNGIVVVKGGIYTISISISFWIVFTNTQTLYSGGIDLFALNEEVVFEGGSPPYWSPYLSSSAYELCSQIHRHLWCHRVVGT